MTDTESGNVVTTGTIEFTAPEWLWLLPLLLCITWLLKIFFTPEKHAGLLPHSPHDITSVIHPLVTLLPEKLLSTRKSHLPEVIITWLVLLLFISAMTQPVRVGKQIPEPEQLRDIVFIVDTSVSMILRDYVLEGKRIDRIGMLKTVIDRFVSKLEGNRLSVIVFGETAHTFVPLTLDQTFIRRMLSRIKPTMAGRYKAIGDAISLAVATTTKSNSKHPVFVLFTDVNTPTGKTTPKEAATMAANAGIPVYTIAIGAASHEAEEKRTSGLIYDPVNLPLLSSIASATGAESYQARDADALRKAINSIDKREKTQADTTPRYFQTALYHWLLIAGVLLIVLYQFVALFIRVRNQ